MKVENNQQSQQPNMQQQMDQMLQQQGQGQPVQPMQPMNGPAKVKKKKNIPAIVLGVVAVLGVGAGAYFGVQYFGEKDRADKLAKQNTTVATVEPEETTSETTAEAATTEVDSSKYIYIGEWGYKIKIPEGLDRVSYLYSLYDSSNKGEGFLEGQVASVEVWGVKGDRMYDFADTTIGAGVEGGIGHPLGEISRYEKGETAKCGASCPTVVFEDDKWEYAYAHPQDMFSETATEQKIEKESTELIQQMLSNKANYSKI